MFVTQIQMFEDPNILFFNLIYGQFKFKNQTLFVIYNIPTIFFQKSSLLYPSIYNNHQTKNKIHSNITNNFKKKKK